VTNDCKHKFDINKYLKTKLTCNLAAQLSADGIVSMPGSSCSSADGIVSTPGSSCSSIAY